MDYKPLDCNIVVVSPQKTTWTTKDLRPNFHPGGLIVCHFVHLFFVILWTSHSFLCHSSNWIVTRLCRLCVAPLTPKPAVLLALQVTVTLQQNDSQAWITIIQAIKAATERQSFDSDSRLHFNYNYCLAVPSLVRVHYLFQSAVGGLQLAHLPPLTPRPHPHSRRGNAWLRHCGYAEISWFFFPPLLLNVSCI